MDRKLSTVHDRKIRPFRVCVRRKVQSGLKLLAIAKQEDAESLQQDLRRLGKWSDQWLLKFNPAKCKVMQIGHELGLPTKYIMKDGDKTIELESTAEEKDLRVNLKSHKQCVQAAKKAQSVLGMIKKHFKVIDQEDFKVLYQTYIRPHLVYYVQA